MRQQQKPGDPDPQKEEQCNGSSLSRRPGGKPSAASRAASSPGGPTPRAVWSRRGLRKIEDEAILEVLDLQRQAGMDVFTDGEYRRREFRSQFADAVEGMGPVSTVAGLAGAKFRHYRAGIPVGGQWQAAPAA